MALVGRGNEKAAVAFRPAAFVTALTEENAYGFLRSCICTSLDQWFSNARTQVDR